MKFMQMGNHSEYIIIVTRPAHQSDALCKMIEQAGFTATSFPTIEIKTLDISEQLNQLKQNDFNSILIFLSRNAVINSLDIISTQCPGLVNTADIIAMGPATAEELQMFGIKNIILPQPPFNSESLLDLPLIKEPKEKDIVIISGEGGRDLLLKALKSYDNKVVKIECYRRECPENGEHLWNQIVKSQIDESHAYENSNANRFTKRRISAIIVTSNEGLDNLIKRAGTVNKANLLALQLIVISERIAKYATELGFIKPPIVSNSATDLALKEAVLKLNK